ncbi:MAG TPA: sugar phosphate nucleotidyltransferase, partial [Solirubrobacterales bacterium]|nr:sugar phosphate nucleotidyltransferase [Solirubrobacterales bacterium]
MKVVIFCGGQGLRMREVSETVPKPMVPIGTRPVLWHVMKYYAHFGFTDFVLCLGYKAEAIKQFFLTYNEAMANDFVLTNGGAEVHLLRTDIHDWNITFVDTGLRASIGERLHAVRHLLR